MEGLEEEDRWQNTPFLQIQLSSAFFPAATSLPIQSFSKTQKPAHFEN